MPSMELLIGWGIIGMLGYVLGVYTTIPARARSGARRGGAGAKELLSLDRLGIPMGFLGGLAVGPWVIATVAGGVGGLIGGFAGGVAFSGIGLTNGEVAIAGVIAVVTFAILSNGSSED